MWKLQGTQGRRQALQTLGAWGLGTAVVTGLAGCGSLNPLSRANGRAHRHIRSGGGHGHQSRP